MSTAKTTVTVTLPVGIKERLGDLARVTSRSEDGLAAEAISSYVDLQEWQVERIQRGLREADAGEFAEDEEVAAVFARWVNASRRPQ